MPAILEARNLVKRFGRSTAVAGISFNVEQGEVLTLLGPSGCGKTTTLRIVAGFEKPDEGELSIQGRTIVSVSRRTHVPPEARGLGMVFQNYAIWPHMTVFENVAYPLKLRKVSASEIRQRVLDILELVGLQDYAARPSVQLSGGQQQRVALARALVYSPAILLLDEPLSNLDAKLREQMRLELKRLQNRLGVTVLFVTHDQIEAMALSSRLAVMNQGHIEQVGAPSDVYEHPQTPFVEDFLGRVIHLTGVVSERTWEDYWIQLNGPGEARLRIETAMSLDPGDAIRLAIRPEDVEIVTASSPSAENTVMCEIESSIYLGAQVELLLRLGQHSFTLEIPRPSLPALGQSVALRLPAAHLRVWPAAPQPDLEQQAAAANVPRHGLPVRTQSELAGEVANT